MIQKSEVKSCPGCQTELKLVCSEDGSQGPAVGDVAICDNCKEISYYHRDDNGEWYLARGTTQLFANLAYEMQLYISKFQMELIWGVASPPGLKLF